MKLCGENEENVDAQGDHRAEEGGGQDLVGHFFATAFSEQTHDSADRIHVVDHGLPAYATGEAVEGYENAQERGAHKQIPYELSNIRKIAGRPENNSHLLAENQH